MLNFCSLYSGSSGNCLFVESQNTKILVDCGTSGKKVIDGLQSIDKNIEDIDAILVTHEHSDHIQSLGMISKKYNIPVYANFETWQAMSVQADKINLENKKIFTNDNNFEIGNLLIHPFSTPHDAANPCGFNIFSGNKKISIATDLGHMDDVMFENLKGSSFVLLEANYDPEILKVSRYPFMLKQRISGPHGHLSNSTSGKTIAKLMDYDLKEVMLGHLSKENNFPELAYQTVAEELMNQNKDMGSIALSVASRVTPSKIINIQA
jgi:phosphoribosyl 1,2-cyclic phosphodiesterase